MKRTVYKPLGFLFLMLALLGIPLPILPTTPFLLLAAWFFARSSPKWHTWLLNSELFGPMIHNWEDNHCIARSTKTVALVSMLITGGASIFFVIDNIWLRALTALFLAIGSATVLSIKTCPEPNPETDASPGQE